MGRAKSAGEMFAITGIWLVQGVVGAVIMWIVSVVFYAVGLWPIGALFTIILFLDVVGFGLLVLFGLGRAVWIAAAGPGDQEIQ